MANNEIDSDIEISNDMVPIFHGASFDGHTPAAEWTPEGRAQDSPQDIKGRLKDHLSASLRIRQAIIKSGKGQAPLPPIDMAASRRIERSIPVTIYLSEGAARTEVQQALVGVLAAFDFRVVDTLPPLEGSWYRAFVARLRRALTSDELAERMRKVERGIELHTLHKKQAEIDSLRGEAVAKLLAALESTPSALIQIGSVLLVKVDGVPAVRNLTQQELIFLENNPNLLRDPAAILDALQKAGQESLPRATKLISS